MKTYKIEVTENLIHRFSELFCYRLNQGASYMLDGNTITFYHPEHNKPLVIESQDMQQMYKHIDSLLGVMQSMDSWSELHNYVASIS